MIYYIRTPCTPLGCSQSHIARQRPLAWSGARRGHGGSIWALQRRHGWFVRRAGIWRGRVGGRQWRRSGGSRWSAFEIIAMVLGFIVFWPIGLAILGYKFWQRRYGGPDLQTLATSKWQDARTMMSGNSSSWGCGAMNRASRSLRRSDRQRRFQRMAGCRNRSARRRAPQARRGAARIRRIFVDAIRRAKDREEFDRFMAERRARPAGGGSNAN